MQSLWYMQPHSLAATCYFKSAGDHVGNKGFSISRLNFHRALLAGIHDKVINSFLARNIFLRARRKLENLSSDLARAMRWWPARRCSAVRYTFKGSGSTALLTTSSSTSSSWSASLGQLQCPLF
ncbi:hypothetical protein ACQJBY_053957 [Aegilops geniculata]